MPIRMLVQKTPLVSLKWSPSQRTTAINIGYHRLSLDTCFLSQVLRLSIFEIHGYPFSRWRSLILWGKFSFFLAGWLLLELWCYIRWRNAVGIGIFIAVCLFICPTVNHWPLFVNPCTLIRSKWKMVFSYYTYGLLSVSWSPVGRRIDISRGSIVENCPHFIIDAKYNDSCIFSHHIHIQYCGLCFSDDTCWSARQTWFITRFGKRVPLMLWFQPKL